LLSFYSHICFPLTLRNTFSPSVPQPWQLLICSPFLKVGHFKNVIKIESYNMELLEILFSTQHNSLEMIQFVAYISSSLLLTVILHGIHVP
jgi:hypothetical protein